MESSEDLKLLELLKRFVAFNDLKSSFTHVSPDCPANGGHQVRSDEHRRPVLDVQRQLQLLVNWNVRIGLENKERAYTKHEANGDRL